MDNINILIKGALLHDIGKVCFRAEKKGENHSSAGVKYLKRFLPENPETKQLFDCVQYHHAEYLKSANVSNDNLCYIVYEADNIASAMDRRKDSERKNESASSGFKKYTPLKNLFYIFNGEKSAFSFNYPLTNLNHGENFNFNYPTTEFTETNIDLYIQVLEKFSSKFKNLDLSVSPKNTTDSNNNILLELLEDLMCYIPSSTNLAEIPDISLFIHSKITAAIASCMKIFFDANFAYQNDYKKYCFNSSAAKKFREENVYLLVKGNFIGMQQFLYTIPTKGALKSLRGRAFYLEILIKQFIDELLEKITLSHANILHCEGDSFYLLLPNTIETIESIRQLQENFNEWLLKNLNSNMYLAIGFSECSAMDLMHSDEQHSIFDDVNSEANFNNYTRYNKEALTQLFSFDGKYNVLADNTRECSICHTSTKELFPYDYDKDYDDEDTISLACPSCLGLYKLGELILTKNLLFIISDTKVIKTFEALPIFSYEKDAYLFAIDNDCETYDLFKKEHNILRLYGKNQSIDYIDSKYFSSNLYIADYSAKNPDGSIMTFDALAQASSGIKRLGVLCLNVDDLEAAFISGFIDKNNSAENATFTRYANLSQNISYFFKSAINKICEGNLANLENIFKPFHIFNSTSSKRNVHIIYSAGNELILVGSWNETLETAIDIYTAFAQFTENKLTLSAGLAMFSARYPISKMIELTKTLLATAKNQPNKNSIALFGFDTEQLSENASLSCNHIYKWQDFINKVCNEKLYFILDKININQSELSKTKLNVGKSLLYRFLDLLDINNKDSLNIAHFSYTLARLQPRQKDLIPTYNNFVTQMYKWIRNTNPTDKKELHTALNLLVYYLRETKED